VEPTLPERLDYEYERHGKANLFVCVEPLTGRSRVRVTQRRTAIDFAQELRQIVGLDYPEAEQIILVCDNLNTHPAGCLYEAFPAPEARRLASKIEWHFTPEHGSWLNIAEVELSVLHRQCLSRRIADVAALEREVAAWQEERNAAAVPVGWQFTTADARLKLRRLYPMLK
jgi:hypothetical protein